MRRKTPEFRLEDLKPTYHVTVDVDGEWKVTRGMYPYDRLTVASGNEPDQCHGELAARYAIEDHKANIAKQRVYASMARKFTVEA